MPKADTIRCPYCRKTLDVDTVEMGELFLERISLAAKLGPAWKLVNEYVDAFRPTPDGYVTMKRRVRVLREVVWLLETEEFELDKKRYGIKKREALAAIEMVCNAQKHGFTNHNYLKRVLVGESAERLSREGATAKQERQSEEKRKAALEVRRLQNSGDGGAQVHDRRLELRRQAERVAKGMGGS